MRLHEIVGLTATRDETAPNQLGVEYNVHVLESLMKYVAPGLSAP